MQVDPKKQPYNTIVKLWYDLHYKEALPLLLAEDDLALAKDRRAFALSRKARKRAISAGEELNIEVLVSPRRQDRLSGESVANPKYYATSEKKLATLQRR